MSSIGDPQTSKRVKRTTRRTNPPAPVASGSEPTRSASHAVDFILSHGGRTSAAAPDSNRHKLRFIDLFCGIGGFRLAFERAGARCVFSSDWDKFARQTYAANFGEEPHGDITKIPVESIPPFEILCGGFPCQRGTMIASISEWSL